MGGRGDDYMILFFRWVGAWTFIYLFEKNAFKGSPEVLVKNCVNNRIEGRVGIAQPKGKCESPSPNTTCWLFTFRVIFTNRTDRTDRIQKKEWKPTGNKTSHNQTKDKGGPPFFFARDSLVLSLAGVRSRAVGMPTAASWVVRSTR